MKKIIISLSILLLAYFLIQFQVFLDRRYQKIPGNMHSNQYCIEYVDTANSFGPIKFNQLKYRKISCLSALKKSLFSRNNNIEKLATKQSWTGDTQSYYRDNDPIYTNNGIDIFDKNDILKKESRLLYVLNNNKNKLSQVELCINEADNKGKEYSTCKISNQELIIFKRNSLNIIYVSIDEDMFGYSNNQLQQTPYSDNTKTEKRYSSIKR